MKYSLNLMKIFIYLKLLEVEINLIMDKLVSLQAKEQYSFNLSIPTYLAKKTSFNIDGLVNIESFKIFYNIFQKQDIIKFLKKLISLSHLMLKKFICATITLL